MKATALEGLDKKTLAWGWAIAIFGVKMVWLPGSIINLLVNCSGVQKHTPDVYSKIFFALIPTFNGWSSLLCIAAGVLAAACLAKRVKIKHAIYVFGLACVSYVLLLGMAPYVRPFVH